jgi:hypothetical protein
MLPLAADTPSIAVMEIVDNALMLLTPEAMDAHLLDSTVGPPQRGFVVGAQH